MDNPMILALQSLFATAKDTYGMCLGGRKFGDRYLEGAFVYRVR